MRSSPTVCRPLRRELRAWLDRFGPNTTVRAQLPGFESPWSLGDSGRGTWRPDALVIGTDFAELVCAEDRWTIREEGTGIRWRVMERFAASQPETYFSIRVPDGSRALLTRRAAEEQIPPSRVFRLRTGPRKGHI